MKHRLPTRGAWAVACVLSVIGIVDLIPGKPAASEPEPAHYLCTEPPRGGRGDPILYHFTFQQGGWFRNAKFVWDDRDVGLEIKGASGDLIIGEVASADYMPDPDQIDQCFHDELALHPTFDLNAVRGRCQGRAALSADKVPIKLVVAINPATGDFKVAREQSKRIARYNTEAYGSCRRLRDRADRRSVR